MKQMQTFMLTVLLNIIVAVTLHASPGALDTSFNGTGKKRMRFEFGDDFANAVTVQPDGKVLVAGFTTITFFSGGSSLVLLRYDTNNILDATFGDGGKVITSLSQSTNTSAVAAAVQVQQDGKIVVAGSVSDGADEAALLVRFNPNGLLDDSFGHGGMVTNNFGSRAVAQALAIQPDGKIVIGGWGSPTPLASGDWALARYETNGVLDTSFNGTGMVLDAMGSQVNGLTIQRDGKIVAAGWGGNFDVGVFRYTTSGALDTTFGPDHTGRVVTHIGPTFSSESVATAVAIEPGDNLQTVDRIVVGGYADAFSPPRFEVIRYTLDGSLDGTFGGSGIVTASAGIGFFNYCNAMLVQGTGTEPRKIILAGTSDDGNGTSTICAMRFNDNGTLDNSFDGDGKVFTSFGSGDNQAHGMAIVLGGKLLIAGTTLVNQNNDDVALVRYNLSNGSLDNSFGEDGRMTQDVGQRPAQAKAVAIQTDGKIIVVGGVLNGVNYGGTHSIALTRLFPDGVPDMSFGQYGKATVTFGEEDAVLNAIAIQPDGKIVGAGFSGTNFLVVRFNTNGVLDPSFNGSGSAKTSIAASGNIANAIALQPDGRIVVAGTTSFYVDFAILRYTTNGALDTTFDGDGKLTIDVDPGINLASAVNIQPDGKIVVAGYSVIGGTRVGFTAVRLRTNGVVDSSFGTFGVLATVIGTPGCQGTAMAVQPDGRFLIAGYAANGTDVDFAMARYDTNGMLDLSFDGDGKVTTPIGLSQDMAMAIGLQSDGKIILAGNATIVGRPEFVALRYSTNGALDTAYGVNGNAFVDFDDRADNNLFGLAMDASGRPVIVGDAGGFFGIAKLQGDSQLRVLSLSRLANGHAVLAGVGAPNQIHTVQSSTNLTTGSFNTLGQTTADAAGLWQYEDAGAATLSQRFYRLVLP